MFVILFGNLLVIPLMFLCHPQLGAVTTLRAAGDPGGFKSDGVLLIVAIVGTTVTPWQLFFQQSNVVDKRITPRWIPYERADTVIGAMVVVIGATAIMIAAAYAFAGTPLHGAFTNALDLADGLTKFVGPAAGAVFAVLLIDASIVGASAVTLSTSYAFGDTFGIRNSLHRSWREAKPFYAMFTVLVDARGRPRADPQRATRLDHDRGAGACRRDAAERLPVPALPLQRPRGARPVGEPADDERCSRRSSSACC